MGREPGWDPALTPWATFDDVTLEGAVGYFRPSPRVALDDADPMVIRLLRTNSWVAGECRW